MNKIRKLTTDLKLTVQCIDEKWFPIAWGRSKLAIIDGSNCALCRVYGRREECSGCPIYNDTGKDNCDGTPLHGDISVADKRAMLNYLIRLGHKLADKLAMELGKKGVVCS